MLKKTFSLCFITILFITVYADTLIQYKIDKNHSNVGFAVSIMGGLSEVHGKFSDFNIELFNDEQDITKSKVKAVIKAASIDTGIDGRDEHLRTADFFDAEKYPDITFESKQIKKAGKGFVATGDLTMHGVTKEVSLPFKIAGVKDNKKERKKNVGYVAEMSLNRKDFGINWEHSAVPNFVGDNVKIKIHLITGLIKY
jgi:polyisoprenoid-binding protein YceI